LDGADTVLPAQARSQVLFGQHGVAADGFANLGEQIHYRRGDGIGWLIFRAASLPASSMWIIAWVIRLVAFVIWHLQGK
jgi:hypothetical protein